MLEQNVSRLILLIGGVVICVLTLVILSTQFPQIQEAFLKFFSQRITKY